MKKAIPRAVSIIVDNDVDYEKVCLGRRIFNHLFWFPFINCLPKGFGSWLFAHSSKRTSLARKYAKTYKALELIYDYNGLSLNDNGVLDGFFSYLWESNMLNAYAVRNRLKLVKKELKGIVQEKKGHHKVKILSLASGSARAVIEVIAELDDRDVEVRLVDISRSALCYSKELARKYGVADKITWFRASARDVERFCNDWNPDIVEMVGLMDYLDSREAVEIITKIHKCLNRNGTLIISNVTNNPERRFVREIANWDMTYRDPHELCRLLAEGGFNNHHYRIVYEPTLIHAVAIASKL